MSSTKTPVISIADNISIADKVVALTNGPSFELDKYSVHSELRWKESERQKALSRILGAIRALADRGVESERQNARSHILGAIRSTEESSISSIDIPEFVNGLNDAELDLLRVGLQKIVRELSAAKRFRSMVERRSEFFIRELESASL